jgi:hypothetical protein
MTFDQPSLEEKSEIAFNLLIHLVTQNKLVQFIVSTYEDVCKDVLSKFDIHPRQFELNDRNRLLFEILCFSTFLITGQEIPKILTRKRFLVHDVPDKEAILYFNTKLLDHLEAYCIQEDMSNLSEVILTAIDPELQYELGDPLNCMDRIRTYVKSGSPLNGAKKFAQNIALSIDPQNYAVVKVIGMKYVEPIVDLVRYVLSNVFGSEDESPKA